MNEKKNQSKNIDKIIDSTWKDLYKLGGIVCLISIIMTIVAIIVFFIWPPYPEDILIIIQEDKIAGLMSLDFIQLISAPFSIPLFFALYILLKRVNKTYALIALVIGIISVILLIIARPILELFIISDKYNAATTEAEKNLYLAAGEAIIALFTGTAWLIYYIFVYLSFLIYSVLMLRTNIFSKKTAYSGIIINIAGLLIFIPIINYVLALLATIGSVLFLCLLARDFFRITRLLE